MYGLLEGSNLRELEDILPQQEEEQLEGLDIPVDDVDVDAVLAKMQGNLDALEDKVGSKRSNTHVRVLTAAPAQRRDARGDRRRGGAGMDEGGGLAAVPDWHVGVAARLGAVVCI